MHSSRPDHTSAVAVSSIKRSRTEAGYLVKQKDGRRNRYQIQAHLSLPEPTSRERSIGDVLAVLALDVGDSGTRERS